MDLGRFGIWRHEGGATPELAQEIERTGFGTVWIGANPKGDLELIEALIAATDRLTVATGIVNVWTVDAAEVADSYHASRGASRAGSCSASASDTRRPTGSTRARTRRWSTTSTRSTALRCPGSAGCSPHSARRC